MERESSFFKAVQPVRAARFKGGEKTQQMGDRATPWREAGKEGWESKEVRTHYVWRAGPSCQMVLPDGAFA